MILDYFALQYSDNRLLAVNNDWKCVYPTDHISSAYLLPAIQKNVSKMQEMVDLHKEEQVSLVVVRIKPQSIKGVR